MASANPIPPPATSIVLPGRRRLVLTDEIARGGSSALYRAVLECELFVRRIVAAKTFDLSSADEPDVSLNVLARAVQRAACVRHPNVVEVYELVHLEPQRVALEVQELVEGLSLGKLLDRRAKIGRRLPLDLALFIATEVAEGLHGARIATTPEGISQGMPHLDLAASEVLLSFAGEVKVEGFGTGRAGRWGSSVRSFRSIAARACTMAPEIARGRSGDTRSDVFSLGVLLREMIVGPRFGGDLSEQQILERAREGFVPSSFNELQLPDGVRGILRTCLEVDPQRRFPHATALAYELRRVSLSLGVGDARMFLRSALAQERVDDEATDGRERGFLRDEEPTEEIDLDAAPTVAPPDRSSGLIAKAARRRPNGTDT